MIQEYQSISLSITTNTYQKRMIFLIWLSGFIAASIKYRFRKWIGQCKYYIQSRNHFHYDYLHLLIHISCTKENLYHSNSSNQRNNNNQSSSISYILLLRNVLYLTILYIHSLQLKPTKNQSTSPAKRAASQFIPPIPISKELFPFIAQPNSIQRVCSEKSTRENFKLLTNISNINYRKVCSGVSRI